MKKIIYFLMLIFFVVIISTAVLASWVGYDYYTYWGTTGNPITVAWDKPSTGYLSTDVAELRAYNQERKIYISLGEVSGGIFSKQISLPRTGHWVVQVRYRRGTSLYSTWTESTNKNLATVNGNQRGWWLFVRTSPPGKIYVGGRK